MNSEFKVLEKDERSYLVAEPFEKLGVINGFSRRLGGVSSGKISGLNFGFRVGDDSDSVLENYNARMDDNYILGREKWWKDTLCTRQFGYNKN